MKKPYVIFCVTEKMRYGNFVLRKKSVAQKKM